MKRKIVYICILITFILILIYNCSAITKTVALNISNKNTKISISVLDYANRPIDNATVCIVEDKTYFYTDKDGNIDAITINATNYNNRNWQGITLLVYRNGYSTNITYNLIVYKNQTRTGIVINLYEIYNNTDPMITTTIENPPTEYNNEIINNYKREK